MRVHVQISDPFELVPATPRGANVQADFDDAELRGAGQPRALVLTSEGLTFKVESVEISSRHVGESLSRLLEGSSVSVNGSLHVADGEHVRFVGSAHDAAKAVGPWPFDDA